MAWELRIRGQSDSTLDSESSEPLGSISHVQAIVDAYFPETDWESSGRGVCSFEDGTIEFDLRCDPVEEVWLRVHDADPALPLIAMARDRQWVVVNDSTGDTLEEEEEVDDQLVSQLQKQAAITASKRKTLALKGKSKLPRVKKRLPLTDVQPAWILDELRMVSLRSDEVTIELFDDYCETMRKDDRYLQIKGHPKCGPNEVHLPDGRRFASLIMGANDPESDSFVGEYCVRTLRMVAKLQNGVVKLPDGSQFEAHDCLWIERIRGRVQK